MVSRALFSSDTYEHFTPEEIVRAVYRVGPIDLDPCSAPGSPAWDIALNRLAPPGPLATNPIDGLSVAWGRWVKSPDALAYWNPPYGRYTCPFLKRDIPRCGECGQARAAAFTGCQGFYAFALASERASFDCRLWKRDVGLWVAHAAAQDCNSVGLLPARTDTKWFQGPIAHEASAVCFFKGRLKFGNLKNSAPFPSLAVLFQKTDPWMIERFVRVFRDFGRVVVL